MWHPHQTVTDLPGRPGSPTHGPVFRFALALRSRCRTARFLTIFQDIFRKSNFAKPGKAGDHQIRNFFLYNFRLEIVSIRVRMLKLWLFYRTLYVAAIRANQHPSGARLVP